MRRIFCLLSVLLVSVICLAFPQTCYADGGVVYVKDSGSDYNGGTGVLDAVQSLDTAVSLAGKGGTVVVCGPLTLSENGGNNVYSNGTRITSVYGGTDYTSSYGAALIIKSHVYFFGDAVLENISIKAQPAMMFFCGGNSITFGNGINTTLNGSGSYPYIFGGTFCGRSGATKSSCTFHDYTVTVNSGTWQTVRGGNYRTSDAHPLGYIGNVSIVINGGSFRGRDALGSVSASGFCGVDGDLSITVNGGSFATSIYAVGRPGSNSTGTACSFQGDVRVEINGGSFNSSVVFSAVQDTLNTKLLGDYSISINGGSMPYLTSVTCEGVEGDARVFAVSQDVATKARGFLPTVFVSENGDDSVSGTSLNSPKKTVASAAKELKNGGTLVVCGRIAVKEGDLDAIEGGKLFITSYACGAERNGIIALSGRISVNAEIAAENITFEAENSELHACGNDITAGEDVCVEGALSFICGDSGIIRVYSGEYDILGGGSGAVMYGGNAKKVYGSYGNNVSENASVVLAGGNAELIVGAQNGASGDVGIAVYSGAPNKIYATESGEISGVFGVIAESGSPAINSAGAKGEKLFSSSTLSIPEGFEDAGTAVFVSDGANGKGFAPTSPAGTVYSGQKTCLTRISSGKMAVIPVGVYTVGENASMYKTGADVTLGGKFCGVDFRSLLGCKLYLGAVLELADETAVTHVDIISINDKAFIAACGNKTVIEGSVYCDMFFERSVEAYPSICGGAVNKALHISSSDITVNGGRWHYLYGGNIITAYSVGAYIGGNLSVVVNNGEFYGGIAANGMNSLEGNASLVINGGLMHCSVYGSANADISGESRVTVDGKISVCINGGELHGDILAARQDEELILNGGYSLTVNGGNIERVSSIRGTEKVSGKNITSDIKIADGIDIYSDVHGNAEFTNPIAYFADPSVIFHQGYYYYTYTKTVGGKCALFITKSANIMDIGAAETCMVWWAGASGISSDVTSLWAPQLQNIDGKWYIYATCVVGSSSSSESRRPCVWVGKGKSIYDGFDYYGVLDNCDLDVYSYLSPRMIRHGGKLYLICGGFFRQEDRVPGKLHKQKLFIGELSSPTSLATKMTVIAVPEYSWEIDGNVYILEGPYQLNSPDGTLYVPYSAGQTGGNEYCTGLLRFNGKEGDSLLDPSLWYKYPAPMQFVDYSSGVYSPGAMVFVPTPDGSGDTWGVFHVKLYANMVYSHRILFTMPLRFENGVPVMDDPKPVDTVFTMPLNPMPLSERIFGFSKAELPHKYKKEYTVNRYCHWYTCIDCGARKGEEVHDFAGGNNVCSACGYKLSDECYSVYGNVTSMTGSAESTLIELLQNGEVLYAAEYRGADVDYSITADPGEYTLRIRRVRHTPVEVTVTLSSDVKTDAVLRLLGDVNGDGKVNASDATQIKRYYNNKSSVFDSVNASEKSYLIKTADVNGDGRVNASDATQIKRYYNNKSSVFDLVY